MERLFCENCGAFLLEYDIEGYNALRDSLEEKGLI